MFKFLRRINPVLFLICFAYLILITFYSDFVPLWDSYEYIDVRIFRAFTTSFNPYNFNLSGHPSMIYAMLTSLGKFIDFGNMPLLHFNVAIFSVIAIVSFYGLLRNLFWGIKENSELYILTFIFAFYPPFVANSIQYSPDYGLLLFFVIFLYLLLADKIFPAAVAGSVFVFTKDAAIAIYIISVPLYFIS